MSTTFQRFKDIIPSVLNSKAFPHPFDVEWLLDISQSSTTHFRLFPVCQLNDSIEVFIHFKHDEAKHQLNTVIEFQVSVKSNDLVEKVISLRYFVSTVPFRGNDVDAINWQQLLLLNIQQVLEKRYTFITKGGFNPNEFYRCHPDGYYYPTTILKFRPANSDNLTDRYLKYLPQFLTYLKQRDPEFDGNNDFHCLVYQPDESGLGFYLVNNHGKHLLVTDDVLKDTVLSENDSYIQFSETVYSDYHRVLESVFDELVKHYDPTRSEDYLKVLFDESRLKAYCANTSVKPTVVHLTNKIMVLNLEANGKITDTFVYMAQDEDMVCASFKWVSKSDLTNEYRQWEKLAQNTTISGSIKLFHFVHFVFGRLNTLLLDDIQKHVRREGYRLSHRLTDQLNRDIIAEATDNGRVMEENEVDTDNWWASLHEVHCHDAYDALKTSQFELKTTIRSALLDDEFETPQARPSTFEITFQYVKEQGQAVKLIDIDVTQNRPVNQHLGKVSNLEALVDLLQFHSLKNLQFNVVNYFITNLDKKGNPLPGFDIMKGDDCIGHIVVEQIQQNEMERIDAAALLEKQHYALAYVAPTGDKLTLRQTRNQTIPFKDDIQFVIFETLQTAMKVLSLA